MSQAGKSVTRVSKSVFNFNGSGFVYVSVSHDMLRDRSEM